MAEVRWDTCGAGRDGARRPGRLLAAVEALPGEHLATGTTTGQRGMAAGAGVVEEGGERAMGSEE